mgnify:CR=1 FL=1
MTDTRTGGLTCASSGSIVVACGVDEFWSLQTRNFEEMSARPRQVGCAKEQQHTEASRTLPA